ncbi:MAG: 16S rRNA (cytidine(1402)-2'-O)-methyltransferase [Cytophagaceae bacterium]|jgi:16S rRNA (cytidine1402-2'-O)-methyltransferase|nr:16S rRNA (cytidine(1402)-2'-O)-methyltransferase [Cytophagaceae bacterium]
MSSFSASLVLVPTPIGNLDDITLRALQVLKQVDLILAEDTRTSRSLLEHFQIKTPLQSYHAHNEHAVLASLVNRLKQGEHFALVTDAGTPGISDPGFLLVRACIQAGISVESLPGATAFVPALVNSGLPCDQFFFYGFLPHKKGRQTAVRFILQSEYTTVLYESPHRMIKLLEQLKEEGGAERYISVSRELTKKFEQTVRGSVEEVLAHFIQHEPKGEFVVVVSGLKQ